MDTTDRYSYLQDLAYTPAAEESSAIPFISDPSLVVPGTEALAEFDQLWAGEASPASLQQFRMAGPKKGEEPQCALHIRLTDAKTSHIYLDGDTWLTSPYVINKFTEFLDSRGPDETVVIHLGVMLHGMHIYGIGAILSAMTTCQAEVVTFAAGRCGFPESMIWCYGKTRKMGAYAELAFEGCFNYKHLPEYKTYFETFRERVQELGLLTQDELVAVFEKFQIVYVYEGKPAS